MTPEPGLARLPAWTGPATSLPPIFVGGTGRSGTTITGKILGSHPAYDMIPFEVRFITDKGGLCDLMEGRTGIKGFGNRCLDQWWHRTEKQGFFLLTDQPTLRAALYELGQGLKTDRYAAGARFVHRMLDPFALKHGKEGWVEMTPPNVMVADTLARMWPNAYQVHSVRDGRDVACSVVPLRWGPGELETALDWWAKELTEAFEVSDRIPGTVLTVQMEELILSAREREYARLLEFTHLDDAPRLRTFFDGQVTPEQAHIGRWKHDVPEADQAHFNAHHDRLAAGILARGWPYRPIEATVHAAGAHEAAEADVVAGTPVAGA